MAEQKEGNNRKQLRPDALVEQLVPDPSQPPQEVRTLVGFLGKSTQAGFWRLYLTSQLNEYVEFRDEDVIHSQSLTTEQSPLGGTIVWVNAEAKLQHTRTVSARRVQAEFLQGSIMAEFLRAPYITQLQWRRGKGDPYAMPGTNICPPNTIICPSFAICVTSDICPPPVPQTPLCPSEIICPTDACPSQNVC